ncbi:fused MFS/spermidine synthase [Rhodobacter sp. Har01]|uniref:fused MFS/spermidine synthase n=1 Tax=Rhodobacter sp. Har01 TaxID=2883999 RepID=UPI0029CA83C4|nr:fused MFS/spermidine synthase [Rhodobacter sp. Har01]
MTRPATAFSGRLALAGLFTLTIFLSASLLFFVQPLFTRIVLPAIGGASAVWTTAMLFFQCVLIGGYLYAHLMTRYLGVRTQMAVHLGLWACALAFLPLAMPEGWSYDPHRSTVVQTLTLFALGVGLPFGFLSANAPLIQSWYGKSGGPSAQDPYFLYGASNLGSLLALLAFPLLAEPLFGATAIGRGWAAGFVVLGLLLVPCALLARGGQAGPAPAETAAARPTAGRILWWMFLAFVPSSLMLGATTTISTDIGSFPLIWVVPLALYLLTFVLAFSNRPWLTAARLRPPFIAALAVLAVLFTGLTSTEQSWTLAGILVLAVFLVSLVTHRMLYEARPAPRHLTLFYLVMSVGGAVGGVFNSIIAPLAFDQFLEFRITVALAAVLLAGAWGRFSVRSLALGLALGVLTLLPLILGPVVLAGVSRLVPALVAVAILAGGLWALGRLGPAGHRGGMVAVLVFLLTAGLLINSAALHRDRSFFGLHAVRDKGDLRRYSNGTTVHGAERVADLTAARPTPITYYSAGGPMGQILSSDLGRTAQRVGVIGLGVGSLACYRQPGQAWHFYEIDRKVDEIARNPALFTFMSACAGDAPTHLGDARIVLEGQPEMGFDLLVIDAYSSDAVPVHLTTVEALALYRRQLAPGGVLVFHISNRFYRIELPLARGAEALGMTAMIRSRKDVSDEGPGVLPSTVVVMADSAEALAPLAGDPRWRPLAGDGGPVWTDDHANLLGILR